MEQNKALPFIQTNRSNFGSSTVNIGKYNFLASEGVLQEKELSEEAATTKRFEYSTLGSELKKQTDIANDQYNLFKDKKYNFVDNNREDGIKIENNETKDNVYYR